MTDGNIDEWVKILTGTGLGTGFLFLGIKWLLSDRMGILKALEQERHDRISSLEESSKSCREDRTKMHEQVNDLQKEVRGLLYRLVSVAAGGKCADLKELIERHGDPHAPNE